MKRYRAYLVAYAIAAAVMAFSFGVSCLVKGCP